MPIIDLPDGNQIDIPDDAPPEVLAAVRTRLQGMGQFGAATKAPEPAGFLESAGRDLMSGFGKGAATIARGASTAAEAFLPKGNELAGQLRGAADSAESYWDRVGAKSTNNEWGQAGLRGVGGAMTTAPTAISAAAGAGAGLGDEAAKRMSGGQNNPLLRFAGSLLGGTAAGTVAGLAARARPQSANVANEAMEGWTPEQLLAGQDYKNRAAARGIDMDLAQAMQGLYGDSKNLGPVRNFLAQRREGNEVQRTLRAQPEQLAREAELTAGSLPGKNFSAAENANFIQRTATGVLSDAKAARSELWSQTVQDGIAALKATEGVKVKAAEEFAKQTGLTLGQARSKVASLLAEVQASKGADTTATAALNKRVVDAQELLASLKDFSLPRGVTATNSGAFSSLPQRGQSIVYDSITREVQRDRAGAAIPPMVESAPGFGTLQKQKALTEAQKALQAQEAAMEQANASVQKARQGLQSTEQVPLQTIGSVHSKLDELISKFPNAVEGAELSNLKANLMTPNGPLTNPDQINRVLTQFTTRLKSPDLKTAGMDAGTSKYLGGVVDSLRNDLGQGFAPIRQANTAYKNFTDSTVNPLKQGPVGLLAQPHGFDPATSAMVSKFEGLMNKGTDPTAKVSDIATAVRELGKRAPTAFEDAFKGWVSRKVQGAIEPGVGNVALSQANPEKLYTNLFKDPLQWQGIKDATAGMAKLRGDNPSEVIRGLENLRQLTVAMKNRPAEIGGVSGSDLKQLGGNSNVANAVRVMSFLPVNRLGEAIERATFGKTLSQLDTILTSPEGAKMLIELGKVPVMSRKAQVILGTWGGGMGNTPGLPDDNTLD